MQIIEIGHCKLYHKHPTSEKETKYLYYNNARVSYDIIFMLRNIAFLLFIRTPKTPTTPPADKPKQHISPKPPTSQPADKPTQNIAPPKKE